MSRFLDLHQMKTRAHRWRLNLVTGETREEPLSERIMEFGSINGRHAGRGYRYVYSATGKPGSFLFDGLVKLDVETGAEQRHAFGDGVYGSESPFAPRIGSRAEDDGYVVSFVTDMNRDCSECFVFDARQIDAGPIARVRLPERISSGTHACWAGPERYSDRARTV
jgi:carotenoid cleavage dioxygenase